MFLRILGPMLVTTDVRAIRGTQTRYLFVCFSFFKQLITHYLNHRFLKAERPEAAAFLLQSKPLPKVKNIAVVFLKIWSKWRWCKKRTVLRNKVGERRRRVIRHQLASIRFVWDDTEYCNVTKRAHRHHVEGTSAFLILERLSGRLRTELSAMTAGTAVAAG